MSLSRRLAIATGLVGLVVFGVLLAGWFSGDPELVRMVAWRAKTNTCVAMVLLSTAMLLEARGGRWVTVLARALSAVALAIGAATLAQYVTGFDLGIDELLAHDPPFEESAAFPNRMAPNAALAIALLGSALLLLTRRTARAGRAAQVLALAGGLLAALALIGYLYGEPSLYQAGAFIRMSPYTAGGALLLATGALALRTDVGLASILAGAHTSGYVARRLLAPFVLVPILLGWITIELEREGIVSDTGSEVIGVLAIVGLMLTVLYAMSRSLDALDAGRRASEEELRRASDLVVALAAARTVDDVARATLDAGLSALGASSGALYRVAPGRAALVMIGTRGFDEELTGSYRTVPMDAAMPATAVARTGEPVFLASPESYRETYPKVPDAALGDASWAALPLEAGGATLAVMVLAFDRPQRFEEATRTRLTRLARQCGQALERALLFAEAAEAREAAERASRAKDEFLAMLGHELRNPFSPIVTSLELMRQRAPDVLTREREVIERQVRHMQRLVDDLLDVSRIARGGVELRRRRVEVAQVAAAAIEIASPLLEVNRHHLTRDLPATGLALNADPERITQVLVNILSNAAKYTEPGGKVSISARREAEEAVIRITDSGAGIAPELLPNVFSLFVQGERTLDRSQGGLGLGLAVVHTLVTAHGGTVEASSAGVGKGSEFTIRLPLAPADAPVVADAADAPAPDTTPAAARTILVVDDNRDAAELIAEALTAAGHTVRTAHDGPTALALNQELHPDLVFLDIGLPVMDGYEVARRIRASNGGPRATLVAITGYGQDTDRAQAMAAGFDRHLVKPVPLAVTLGIAAGTGSGAS